MTESGSRNPPGRWVMSLATLGPLGRVKKAPGTAGSAAGVLWYGLVFHSLGWVPYGVLLAITIGLAVVICGGAEKYAGRSDPSEVILDEFVAVPLCFIGLNPAGGFVPVLLLLVCGFGIFRFFDILKPLGIKKLQDLPGGWGVVADDVAAGLATCLVLQAGVRVIGLI